MKVGKHIKVRGHDCVVIAVHPAGTVDVQSQQDPDRCWRLAGLPLRGRETKEYTFRSISNDN